MSQKELSKDIVSRSHLSFIENNKYDISIGLFLQLINKLHIPIDEFFYIANNYSVPERKNISIKVMNAANKGSYLELKEIQKHLKNDLIYNKKEYEYHHYYSLTELYIYLLDNNFTVNKQVQIIVQPIKEYLFNLSNWYLYDLKLFNNILFTFETIDIEGLAKKLFLSIKKYQDDPSARDDYLNILVNISTYFNEHGKYVLSLKFAELGKEKAQKGYRIYEKIILDINTAVAEIKLIKNVEINKKLLENRLFLMESLELRDLKKHYESLIKKYGISL